MVFEVHSYERSGLLRLICGVQRAGVRKHVYIPLNSTKKWLARQAQSSRIRSDAVWWLCERDRKGGGGCCAEILLESLTVCFSPPSLPDGHGLSSGTAMAQSIRQPSLKPM